MKTDVAINKKDMTFEVTHTWDEGQAIKDNYEARKENPTGNIEGGKAKRIASIPRINFMLDPDLKRYTDLRGKDDVEAAKIMDAYLWKHPEYRTCEIGARPRNVFYMDGVGLN